MYYRSKKIERLCLHILCSNCCYFSCYLFCKLSEIIPENVNITLFMVTKNDCWYFVPYIYINNYHFCMFYTKKSVCFAPTPLPRNHRRPPSAFTAPTRPQAGIVFGFDKNRCTHIFSILSPESVIYLFCLEYTKLSSYSSWKFLQKICYTCKKNAKLIIETTVKEKTYFCKEKRENPMVHF